MPAMTIQLHRDLAKTFVLHNQGGTTIPAFGDIELIARAGEYVCLFGPSGAGKSTVLRSPYAKCEPDAGWCKTLPTPS